MEEGCLWQGPWGVKGGTHRGAGGNGAALGCWLGLKAWREGPVSGGGNRDCANEPRMGFFLPPVHLAAVLHSLQTCPELFEHCAVIAFGDLGRETLWECRYLPYSKTTR